jgi:hypothetical protein
MKHRQKSIVLAGRRVGTVPRSKAACSYLLARAGALTEMTAA